MKIGRILRQHGPTFAGILKANLKAVKTGNGREVLGAVANSVVQTSLGVVADKTRRIYPSSLSLQIVDVV